MKFVGLPFVVSFLAGSSSMRMVSGEDASLLSVTASSLFSVELDRANRTWEEYESELVESVDLLSLEVVALMNSRWNDPEVDDPRPEVQLQLPVSLGISKGSMSDSACPTDCQRIYASATLLIDPIDDPLTMEAAFERTFLAAIGHGRLQDILDDVAPDFFVDIHFVDEGSGIDGDEDVKGSGEEDVMVGNIFGDDSLFFGGPPLEGTTSSKPTTSDAEEGLSIFSVLGMLGAALLALGFAMIALWVVRQKRRSAPRLDIGKNAQNGRRRPRRNRKFRGRRGGAKDLPQVDTDLDLVETFSGTGLEWGSPDAESGDPVPPRKRSGSDASHFSVPDTSSIDGSPLQLPPYQLPPQLRMTTTPDSIASTKFSTAFSLPTPDSSNGNSAMGRYSLDSMGSSEMNYQDNEEYNNAPAPNVVKLEQLENALGSNDWPTLAQAAHYNLVASETGSVQSSASHREERNNRPKDWHKTMDTSKAAQLDKLVQEEDWEGILHLAQTNSKTSKRRES